MLTPYLLKIIRRLSESRPVRVGRLTNYSTTVDIDPNYHQFGVDVFVILLNKQEADALGVQFIKGFHRGVPGIFLGW